ncbi:uncharacterized protein B0I36DRAFT_386001 [Microdochium trichocladiopsis]|uniref:Uncharacterized protein n=1 Tax=Microdochium trichocladiopsis TaxID=1682393 RepID=A0A9P8Y548_9PEZI|nr:uncharacterized protein B0I36DRAFT_386001 [Microdochium trichocladiopsis]KAH7028122.1 hypothetical protein B0I36DRAFT_386001 [Microdochium trichocladiopsis]
MRSALLVIASATIWSVVAAAPVDAREAQPRELSPPGTFAKREKAEPLYKESVLIKKGEEDNRKREDLYVGDGLYGLRLLVKKDGQEMPESAKREDLYVGDGLYGLRLLVKKDGQEVPESAKREELYVGDGLYGLRLLVKKDGEEAK